MTMQMKGCPKCKQPNEIHAPQCGRCGHQFRTYFVPPDQTQMLSPQDVGRLPQDPAPVYHATTSLVGPLDNTERSVAFVWTCVGLFLAALFFVAALHGLADVFRKGAAETDRANTLVFGFLYTLLAGFILSGLTMRLRRLYLSAPGAQRTVETARRRAWFSVVASMVLVLLVVVGRLLPEGERRPAALSPASGVRTVSPAPVIQPLNPPPSTASPEFTPNPADSFIADPPPAPVRPGLSEIPRTSRPENDSSGVPPPVTGFGMRSATPRARGFIGGGSLAPDNGGSGGGMGGGNAIAGPVPPHF